MSTENDPLNNLKERKDNCHPRIALTRSFKNGTLLFIKEYCGVFRILLIKLCSFLLWCPVACKIVKRKGNWDELLSQRLLGQLLGKKNVRQLTGDSSETIPEATAGCILAPVPTCFLVRGCTTLRLVQKEISFPCFVFLSLVITGSVILLSTVLSSANHCS